MDPLFRIQFGRSKSPSLQEVLKHCRKFSNFSEGDTNILQIDDFNEIVDHKYDFATIIRIASGWKSFSMIYNAHPVKSPDNYADTACEVAGCIVAKSKSKDAYYCSEKDNLSTWGCRLVNFIGGESTKYALNYWFEYGHFAEDKLYVIDKKRLFEALMSEAKDKMCDNCQFFDKNSIIKQVSLLPDDVDYTDQQIWAIVFRTEYDDHLEKIMIPISIRLRSGFEKIMNSLEIGMTSVQKPFVKPSTKITNAEANKMIDLYFKNK